MNAAQMLELQLIDTALDQLVHRRRRLPELELKAVAVKALHDLERQIAEAEQSVIEALAVITSTEAGAAELTAKRGRLEQQLKTVISPREAEALMHEIEHINEQRSQLDDQELAALEVQSAGETLVAELDARRAPMQSDVDAAQQALDAVTADLDQGHEALAAQRATAAGAASPEGLALYEQARTQFAGVAVAQLDGLRCQGCHLDMSRGEADIIRAMPVDALPECPQCGRYLVR